MFRILLAGCLLFSFVADLVAQTPSFPGTSEGLILRTAVGGQAPDTVDQKSASVGQQLRIEVANTNTALVGAPLAVGVNVLPAGAAPVVSIPGLAFDLARPLVFLTLGNVGGATPVQIQFVLPPGAVGTRAFVQGVAVPFANPSAVANLLFASTDAHRIDIAPPVFVEDVRLVGNDTAADDNFGRGVSIEGGVALVGAPGNDRGARQAVGAAYTFDVSTGAQVRKITAAGGGSLDNFGDNLAMNRGRAIIGAPRFSGVAQLAGSIYGFTVATGQQLIQRSPIETVSASLIGQSLGSSTAFSDRFVVSGARGDVGRANGGGSLYIYDAMTFNLVHKLFPNDPGFADNFGFSVATSGAFAAAGSPFDNDNGNDSGSVYVFDAVSGTQLHKLVPNDTGAGDLFGVSLDMEGTTIVVGAGFSDEVVGGVDAGSAYVYDAPSGQLIAKLTSSTPQPGARFGEGVAISRDYIVIAAPIALNSVGVAAGVLHVYDRQSLVELATFEASDGLFADGLGQDIDISGSTVIAGAQGVDANGNLSGAAYVFTIR